MRDRIRSRAFEPAGQARRCITHEPQENTLPGGGIAQHPPRRIMTHQLYLSESIPARASHGPRHSARGREPQPPARHPLRLRERNGFARCSKGTRPMCGISSAASADRRHFQVIQRMSSTADVRDFDGWHGLRLARRSGRFLNNRLSEGDWGQSRWTAFVGLPPLGPGLKPRAADWISRGAVMPSYHPG